MRQPHQHNVIMTSSPSALQRISTSSRGARMGAWLVGMGAMVGFAIWIAAQTTRTSKKKDGADA